MAKNTNNRIAVKWVRDKAKSAYEKESNCYICNCEEDLELHHTHSITALLENWAKKNGHDITTDDGILSVRDEFIEQHYREIYDEVYTLCNSDHVRLHKLYGAKPPLATADKQSKWIEIQRNKHLNSDNTSSKVANLSHTFFSEFI